mgnify:CR=1 FL=1
MVKSVQNRLLSFQNLFKQFLFILTMDYGFPEKRNKKKDKKRNKKKHPYKQGGFARSMNISVK